MKTGWMKSLGCLLMVCATAHASVTVEKNVSGIMVRNGEEVVIVSVYYTGTKRHRHCGSLRAKLRTKTCRRPERCA